MRRTFLILLFFSAATVAAGAAQQPAPQQPPASQPQAQPAQAPATAPAPAPTLQAPVVAPTPPAPERRPNVVVLDPAHGGTDPGARGTAGAVEKDMVLIIARVVRIELERQGYRVIMTRDNDQNPSFEDRAAIANAQRGAVFISFHVSSTGAVGTARVYSYEFSNPPPAASPGSQNPAAATPPVAVPAPVPAGWTAWNLAQKSHADLSRRLADVLQVEMSQRFKGSPEISSAVAVRGLRSVAEPAVAVELSSVAVEDPKTVEGMASSLAVAIGRALAAFRPVYEGAR